jgi:hypothetical protein
MWKIRQDKQNFIDQVKAVPAWQTERGHSFIDTYLNLNNPNPNFCSVNSVRYIRTLAKFFTVPETICLLNLATIQRLSKVKDSQVKQARRGKTVTPGDVHKAFDSRKTYTENSRPLPLCLDE